MGRVRPHPDTGERPGAEESEHPAPPLWHESLWPLDWLALRLSPIYYGAGVPRGDGGAVVIVPGFLGTDFYLSELYLWLSRIGYRPYMSGIGLNAKCPDRLTRRLLQTMERAHADTGRPVRVIGHSLGGIIGHGAIMSRPELACQLIYLGTPVQHIHAHPAVMVTAAALHRAFRIWSPSDERDCLTEGCSCGFVADLARPLPSGVYHAAVYSRGDGVVYWHDAQERDPRRNYEVGGTHVGLVFNPRAYRVLAGLLARPCGASRPSEPWRRCA